MFTPLPLPYPDFIEEDQLARAEQLQSVIAEFSRLMDEAERPVPSVHEPERPLFPEDESSTESTDEVERPVTSVHERPVTSVHESQQNLPDFDETQLAQLRTLLEKEEKTLVQETIKKSLEDSALLLFQEKYFLEVAEKVSAKSYEDQRHKKEQEKENQNRFYCNDLYKKVPKDVWREILSFTDGITLRAFKSSFKYFSKIKSPKIFPSHIKIALQYFHIIDQFPKDFKATKSIDLLVDRIPLDYLWEIPISLNRSIPIRINFNDFNLNQFEALRELFSVGLRGFIDVGVKFFIAASTDIKKLKENIEAPKYKWETELKATVYWKEGGMVYKDLSIKF